MNTILDLIPVFYREHLEYFSFGLEDVGEPFHADPLPVVPEGPIRASRDGRFTTGCFRSRAELEAAVLQMRLEGHKVDHIVAACGICVATYYKILRKCVDKVNEGA